MGGERRGGEGRRKGTERGRREEEIREDYNSLWLTVSCYLITPLLQS